MKALGGIFDLDAKVERLEEVEGLLAEPGVWDEREKFQALNKEKQTLSACIDTFKELGSGFDDIDVLVGMAAEDNDEAILAEAEDEISGLEKKLVSLEFKRMFSGEHDSADCYMDIQSGSGGTEAQDWASMVMRMYLKFADKNGFKADRKSVV